MRSTSLVLFAFLFMVPVLTRAQSPVDGKWMGEFQGGRGTQMVHLSLKAEGGKLTGSVMGGRGGEVPIQDGTFANNELKFTTHQQGRGGEITLTWEGMLKGEEIAMKRMFEGRGGEPQEFMLKKEK